MLWERQRFNNSSRLLVVLLGCVLSASVACRVSVCVQLSCAGGQGVSTGRRVFSAVLAEAPTTCCVGARFAVHFALAERPTRCDTRKWKLCSTVSLSSMCLLLMDCLLGLLRGGLDGCCCSDRPPQHCCYCCVGCLCGAFVWGFGQALQYANWSLQYARGLLLDCSLTRSPDRYYSGPWLLWCVRQCVLPSCCPCIQLPPSAWCSRDPCRVPRHAS